MYSDRLETYALTAFAALPIDHKMLGAAINADVGITAVLESVADTDDGTGVIFQFDAQLSAPEKTALDALVAAFDCALDCTKARLIQEIVTHRNTKLKAAGIEWPAASGKFFDISPSTRGLWNGLYNRRALLAYPYTILTRDGLGFHAIATSTEVEDLHAAIFNATSAEYSSSGAAEVGVASAGTVGAAETAAASYLAS